MFGDNLSISMEALLYPQFYLAKGVRLYSQLKAPRLFALSLFEFPKGSIVHYWPTADYLYGPSTDEFWVQRVNTPIFIDHVSELVAHDGSPIRSGAFINQLITSYRKTHRKFRPLINLDTATRDPKTLIVRNYAMLPHMWKYRQNMMTSWYRWANLRKTFWDGVEEYGQRSDREQYVFITLPQRIPTKAEMMKAQTAITGQVLKIFNTPESLNLLDLWEWLGVERNKSLMSSLSEKTLEKLNFVFVESGKFSVLSAAVIDRWRKMSDEELMAMDPAAREAREAKTVSEVSDSQIQLHFMAYCNALVQTRSLAAVGGAVEDTSVVQQTPDENAKVIAVSDVADTSVIPPVVGATVVSAKSKDAVAGKPETVKMSPAASELIDAPRTNPLSDSSVVNPLDDDKATVYDDIDPMDEVPELELTELDIDEPSEEQSLSVSEQAWSKIGVVPDPRYIEPKNIHEEHKEAVLERARSLADAGLISGPEYRRFEKLASSFERIPNPVGTGTLKDLTTISPNEIQDVNEHEFPDADTILDKSMLKSTLVDYDAKYINNLLQKNIATMVLHTQKMGIAVADYKVQRVSDAMGETDQYAVKLAPVTGSSTTLKFTLPVVKPNGVYVSGGVKYRLRRQRGDLPIRKIKSNQVALTSFYGKLFVTRGERVSQNYGKWLRERVQESIVTVEGAFTDVQYGNHIHTQRKLPRVYTALSTQYGGFTYHPNQDVRWVFNFDYGKHETVFNKDMLTEYEVDDLVLVGQEVSTDNKITGLITMDFGGVLYMNRKRQTTEVLGTMEDIFGYDSQKAPIEFPELKVLGKPIMVGFILAYYYGLGKLCRLLNVEPRRVPRGSTLNLKKDEWVLRFSDETLVFDRDNPLAVLVLGGLRWYQRYLVNYSVLGFDNKEIYSGVLAQMGLGQRYIRELDLLRSMFVDHITRDLLIMQKEPTNFDGLLMRSCELLLTDQTPDETDLQWQLFRGYERFAGAVYKELVNGVRAYYANPATSKAAVAIPHSAVFQAIQNDSAQIIVEESNPIHNLKEKEAVTFNGTGGRTGRTMSKRTRVFHPNDRGIISESTVDNSDVAVNTYMSANPKLTSLYGTTGLFDKDSDGMARQLSTSAMVSPGATNDDPKRVNFIAIQHSSGISAHGYGIAPLLTGYEQIIPHRVDDIFCHTAKADGKVIKRDRDTVHVTYPGTQLPDEVVRIGTEYGVSKGSIVPHRIATDLRTGDTFKVGDAIAYNTGFFAPDFLNPGRVMWKSGVNAKVALMETADTTDDSSAISQWLSEMLTTSTCKVRTIMVGFDQAIRNLVELGDKVDADDILCNIEDPLTTNYDLFNDESISSLRVLSANSPRVKYPGIVSKIEVVYNGVLEDMSPTLKALAEESDAVRKRLAMKLQRGDPTTGQIVGFGRIEGTTLEIKQMAIRVYIVGDLPAGAGDKGVFGNQLKSVFRRVMTGVNKTESGEDIDAIFGYTSIDNRIVTAPVATGTTQTLLRVLGKAAVKVFRGKK